METARPGALLPTKETLRKSHYWIADALSGHRKGALHRALGYDEGEVIPVSELRKAARRPGRIGRMARLAITLRRLGRHRRRK